MLSFESKVQNKIDNEICTVIVFCLLIMYYGNLRVKLVYSFYLFNNWKNISSEMLSKSNTMKFNSLSDNNQNKFSQEIKTKTKKQNMIILPWRHVFFNQIFVYLKISHVIS